MSHDEDSNYVHVLNWYMTVKRWYNKTQGKAIITASKKQIFCQMNKLPNTILIRIHEPDFG